MESWELVVSSGGEPEAASRGQDNDEFGFLS
jgi:hypothetical protein